MVLFAYLPLSLCEACPQTGLSFLEHISVQQRANGPRLENVWVLAWVQVCS